MKNKRELYKEKADAQLNEWSATIDVLKARVDKLTANAKLEMQPYMETLQTKFAAAQKKFEKFEERTDDKWDEFVNDVEEGWKDFKASIEGTFDALKAHT